MVTSKNDQPGGQDQTSDMSNLVDGLIFTDEYW